MNKKNVKWTIRDLQMKYDLIEFLEYQREPTVWNIDNKRKLIDSILRNFDIANIYLYKRDDDNYECIDGRQRINAIYSFLGLNEQHVAESDTDRYDNNFKFISSDELLGTTALKEFNNKRWTDLTQVQREKFLNYEFNVLEISDIDKEEELNLMFLRLQLGAHLNAGEKLKAMMGDMRDFIFKDSKHHKALGQHAYFDYLNIPKRRFSKELTAAQIAINFFSLKQSKSMKRARFVDLQDFFKTYIKFEVDQNNIASLLEERLNDVNEVLPKENKLNLKNRAIGITVFFFINELIEKGQKDEIPKFIEFLRLFSGRLKEQVEKGIDIEQRYRDLLRFQTYISQAAVEKYAIEGRQQFLKDYFDYFMKNNEIKGDSSYD